MTSDLHHLAAAYALDALDADERRAFEAHYPSCEICAREVAEFREVAGALASTMAEAPPRELRDRVMAEVAMTRQLAPIVTRPAAQPARRRLPALAAAAAMVVIAALAAVALWPAGSPTVDEVVSAPDRVVTALDALTGADGQMQVIWSAERDQVVVIGTDLEPLDSDRAYALWFILDDESVAPAALFDGASGDLSEVATIDDLEPVGWGITIEPAVGSPQPTSDVLFAGTL